MNYDEIVKKFTDNISKLSYRKNHFQVFDDLMTLFAIEMENPFVLFQDEKYKQREKTYNDILDEYKDYNDILHDCFNLIVWAHQVKRCDFLGNDVFMRMQMNSKNKLGQVFTPYSVCEMMADTCYDKEVCQKAIDEKGYISVLDPASGAGALLIASFYKILDLGFNPQQVAFFVASDLDDRCCKMSLIQLSLLGAKARIDNMDSLTLEHFNTYYTPNFRANGMLTLNLDNIDKEVADAFDPMKKDADDNLKRKYKKEPEKIEQAKQTQIFKLGEQLTLF